MNFMQNDEYLILMNHCRFRTVDGPDPYHILTTQERSRLYDCGIRTAHEQPAWSHVQPSKDSYDFGYLDHIITTNRDAGLKSLIQISGWRPPKWMPSDWFAKYSNGVVDDGCLSFWNEEAQEYSDKYYKTVCDFYANQKDVEFFFGEYQGGEGAIGVAHGLATYDDAALEDFRKNYGPSAMPRLDDPDTMVWFGDKIISHYLRKSALLYPYWHEVWNAQQYLMNVWTHAFGNFVQPQILEASRKKWPDGCIVLLQYTYFDSAHDQNNERYVDELVNISKCEVIAEAMFCAGLPYTTPKAIAKGFRGQIIHPQKDGFSNGELEDWMVEAIRTSHNTWKVARENT